MGDDDYDDYSKELNQYRRSKDSRGRGEESLTGDMLARAAGSCGLRSQEE
jgi:hypothetical protein